MNLMDAFLLSCDETGAVEDVAASPAELSQTEMAINHWIDIAEKYLDRYLVTPLLGPDPSATR